MLKLQHEEYDLTNYTNRYSLYREFTGFHASGYSVPILSDFANNPIYKELVRREDYFVKVEWLYIDLRERKSY